VLEKLSKRRWFLYKWSVLNVCLGWEEKGAIKLIPVVRCGNYSLKMGTPSNVVGKNPSYKENSHSSRSSGQLSARGGMWV